MDVIKIGTLNCQNNKVNRNGGLRENGIDNTELLAKHIEKTGYYCLGTQELTRVFSSNLVNNLKKYKLYGNYRMGSSKLIKTIKPLDLFNENNAIITSGNVTKTETRFLPWFPNNPKDLLESIQKGSIMPRIITSALIENPDMPSIYAINTHLDYQLESVQRRQIKNILKVVQILSKQYPIVLTGDLNMDLRQEHFKEFVESLTKLGLKRVEMNESTYPGKTIDHIFIPKEWIVEKTGLIDDENLEGITDHKGVYSDVKIR